MLTGMHIVITGSPVQGFEYIGPFKTRDDAETYIERILDRGLASEAWAAPLHEPQELRQFTGPGHLEQTGYID